MVATNVCRGHSAGGYGAGVTRQGVAGNWAVVEFSSPRALMTVFSLFARLWRRSGLITDVQFAEMRYHGKPARPFSPGGFAAVVPGIADELPDSWVG